jgi:hypothetical protein
MGLGIECYDASGNLTFSADDYLGRVLGTINVVGANNNGSFTDANLLSGTPWALFFSDGSGAGSVTCVVSVSGNLINWTFGGLNANNSGFNPSGFILYGIK